MPLISCWHLAHTNLGCPHTRSPSSVPVPLSAGTAGYYKAESHRAPAGALIRTLSSSYPPIQQRAPAMFSETAPADVLWSASPLPPPPALLPLLSRKLLIGLRRCTQLLLRSISHTHLHRSFRSAHFVIVTIPFTMILLTTIQFKAGKCCPYPLWADYL